mgnify:CR=1 FL=1
MWYTIGVIDIVFKSKEKKMMLTGFPMMLLILWVLSVIVLFVNNYRPTKLYYAIGIVLAVISFLDVFIINADKYPL